MSGVSRSLARHKPAPWSVGRQCSFGCWESPSEKSSDIMLFPRSRVAELSKPQMVIPMETVAFKEANGELYVKVIKQDMTPRK